MNKTTLIRILWMAGSFLFVMAIISAVSKKKDERAKGVNIRIEGEKNLINEAYIEQILAQSSGSNLRYSNINSLRLREVEDAIEKSEFVYDADVYVDAQDIVQISVHLRQPLVRVIDNTEQTYYIDNEGEIISWSGNYTARVPVATGNISPDKSNYKNIENHVLKGLIALMKHIADDPFLWSITEQIYVDNDEEFSLISKVGSYRIVIGKANDLEEKLDKLIVFYQEGLPYEDWKKYSTINLKFNGQVVCTKR